MNESTLGTAALVHLASMADYLDADGPLLLSDDLAVGLEMLEHRWLPKAKPGLGIEMQMGKIFG